MGSVSQGWVKIKTKTHQLIRGDWEGLSECSYEAGGRRQLQKSKEPV